VLSDGESVTLTGGKDGSRLLLIGGKPIKEPIVQYGPFVMNSVKEIEQAIRDVERGKFGPIPE
jgi:redox-sensitive bicupin YhaK (pirin superfamily)